MDPRAHALAPHTPAPHASMPHPSVSLPAPAAAGRCRVTLVAPHHRVDVSLPDDIPAADLLPELLRLSGLGQLPGREPGFALTRADGRPVDPRTTLLLQDVRDGELLRLRPLGERPAPPVHDDLSEAVAAAVAAQHPRWEPRHQRAAALAGGAAATLLLTLLLDTAPSARGHHGGSLPGLLACAVSLLLVLLAGVAAQLRGDARGAVVLGLAALPPALLSGAGLAPTPALTPAPAPASATGTGALPLLTGLLALLLVSVLLIVLLPTGHPPFTAAAVLAVGGALGACATAVCAAPAARAAAGTGVAAVALIGFLPALSVRLARLPLAPLAPLAPDDPDRPDQVGDQVADRTRRGHEILTGLTLGCAALAAASAAVLCLPLPHPFHTAPGTPLPDRWRVLLSLAVGTATLLRARLFARTSQVLALKLAGAAALAAPVLAEALHPAAVAAALGGSEPTVRTVAVLAVVAAAAGSFVAGSNSAGRPAAPGSLRLLDILDGLATAALLPLALAVWGVYTAVRGLPG